jgi:heme exporter protein A
VSESTPVISLQGLRRQFGERVALAGVDADLTAGATLAVVGPNGSGKSTLLRILAGLLRPGGGEATVLGARLPAETWRLRGRVGYLGHQPLLYRDLTARENLALSARLHQLDAKEAAERIEGLLDAVGMTTRADDRVAEFSAGMSQRVDICRTVLHRPELLLLDEPEAHLDSDAQELVRPLIGRGAGTRVLVSHDRERAAGEADHVLELG